MRIPVHTVFAKERRSITRISSPASETLRGFATSAVKVRFFFFFLFPQDCYATGTSRYARENANVARENVRTETYSQRVARLRTDIYKIVRETLIVALAIRDSVFVAVNSPDDVDQPITRTCNVHYDRMGNYEARLTSLLSVPCLTKLRLDEKSSRHAKFASKNLGQASTDVRRALRHIGII